MLIKITRDDTLLVMSSMWWWGAERRVRRGRLARLASAAQESTPSLCRTSDSSDLDVYAVFAAFAIIVSVARQAVSQEPDLITRKRRRVYPSSFSLQTKTNCIYIERNQCRDCDNVFFCSMSDNFYHDFFLQICSLKQVLEAYKCKYLLSLNAPSLDGMIVYLYCSLENE